MHDNSNNSRLCPPSPVSPVTDAPHHFSSRPAAPARHGTPSRRLTASAPAAALSAALSGLLGACALPELPPPPQAAPTADRDAPAALPNGHPADGSNMVLRAEPPSNRGNPDSYVVFGERYRVQPTSAGYKKRGHASWYGPKFHGRLTSSGEVYDMHQISAAHKSLPIPTYVRVTRVDNGRSIVVRVNDRGPFVGDRLIDLSLGAAKALDMVDDGMALVDVVALPPYQWLEREGDTRLARAGAPAAATAVNTTTVATVAGPVRDTPQVSGSGTATAAVHTTTPGAADTIELANAAVGAAAQPVTPLPTAYLQIAAYSVRQRAEQVRRLLSTYLNQQTTVHSQPDASGEVALHRVRVGPLGTDADELGSLKLRLAELGFDDAYLVYLH